MTRLTTRLIREVIEESISEQIIIQILERQGYSDIKSHDISEAMKEVLADNYNKILEKYNEIAK